MAERPLINGQEVLVDISLSSKGEGLRPYLAKDAVAHNYLEQYQKTGFSQNKSALFGSAAIGLIAGGVLAPQDSRWGPFEPPGLYHHRSHSAGGQLPGLSGHGH